MLGIPLGSSPIKPDSCAPTGLKYLKIAILNYTYGTNGLPVPSDMPYAVAMLEKEKVIGDLQKAEEIVKAGKADMEEPSDIYRIAKKQ